MTRLQAKDPVAFALLYDYYAAAIYGITLRIVGCEQAAQDITQETFVKVWHALPSYDSTRYRLFTWLLNIARHKALDKIGAPHYRQSKPTQGNEESTDCQSRLTCKPFTPTSDGIRELVTALKPEQRQIIDLMYFGGYSQSEIAGKLALPLGTVKTRARSALRTIRKLLASYK